MAMPLEYASLVISVDIGCVLRFDDSGVPAIIGAPEHVDRCTGCDAVMARPSVGFRMGIGEMNASLVVAFVAKVAL